MQDWLTQSKRAREIAAQRLAAAPAAAPIPAAPTPAVPEIRPIARKKLGYKEQRELEGLPAVITALEEEQGRIAALLALDGGALYASDASRAAELAERHARIDDDLLSALERQEALGTAR